MHGRNCEKQKCGGEFLKLENLYFWKKKNKQKTKELSVQKSITFSS